MKFFRFFQICFCVAILFLQGCNYFSGVFPSANQKSSENNQLLLLLGLASNTNTFNWNLPPGFPTPAVPSDNPMTREKVALGRFLFYDTKLSGNGRASCSSCHLQNLAFTDGKANAVGSTGQVHPRNSMSLVNVVYNSVQTWNNPLMKNLETQALVPLTGSNPIELGLNVTDSQLRDILYSDSRYQRLFADAFPGDPNPVGINNVIKAISSFQRTLISGNSAFDQAIYRGNSSAMSASARRGMNFFNGEVAECFHCHGGFNFSDVVQHAGTTQVPSVFHNNAIYNVNGAGPSSDNMGVFEVTGKQSDVGLFKAPSLRNIALTFPYMHDGSIMCENSNNPAFNPSKTSVDCARDALGKVIDNYARGGFNSSCPKTNPSFPCLTNTPFRTVDTTLIRPTTIQPSDKADLIEFFLSLTDNEFVNNPTISNPFR